ncbi:MAG: helix-turn-helix transcriptional regulator [Parachlamydiales bacterium]
MKEALNLYLEEPADSSYLFPLPKKQIEKSAFIVDVPVNPLIAFSFLVRYCRISNNLTQKEIADELNAGIYSYQRLEKKSNPTLKTISKIKEIFPEFPIDLVFS